MRALPRLYELVSFRSVFFPFLSLSPYTLLFPTDNEKLPRVLELSNSSNPLPFPRFASINASRPDFFLSKLAASDGGGGGGHFSLIFGARIGKEPLSIWGGYGICVE